jgi:hypothetical protein
MQQFTSISTNSSERSYQWWFAGTQLPSGTDYVDREERYIHGH